MTDAQPGRRDRPEAAQPTVLVVEDETLVRMAISLDLADAGFRMIEAANATEALDVLEAHQVDLVFTDIRMPGAIDGLALMREVRRRFPGLPVILTSAHAELSEQARDGAALVPKPYSARTVLSLISQRIGRRAAEDGAGAI